MTTSLKNTLSSYEKKSI